MPENISRPPNTASGIVLEQGITALAEADAEHKKYKADQNRRGCGARPKTHVARDAARAVAHQITAERRGEKVAEAGCDREIALVHRVQLFRKELPRDSRRHNHGICQHQRDLGSTA